MAEITRVPLQPIAKGSLTKMWLAIIALVLVAAGAAWAMAPGGSSLEGGVRLTTLQAGNGTKPAPEDVVFVKYVGTLADGSEFDRSQPMPFDVGDLLPEGTPMALDGVIPGFRTGLLAMEKGGKYELFIPADQAYGAGGPPGAPQGDLTFQVEVVDILSREETEARFQAVQQMMLQQMGGAAPGGESGAAPQPGE
jgi:FKBP-type peptidyl-prolyl cis-trans isomerase FkpA